MRSHLRREEEVAREDAAAEAAGVVRWRRHRDQPMEEDAGAEADGRDALHMMLYRDP